MSTTSPTIANDVCAPASRPFGDTPKPATLMKCAACSRTLTRAAYAVGNLTFGPVCFKKLLKAGQVARKVDLRPAEGPGELFGGCYFDIQGAADRAAMTGVSHA